MQLRNASSGRSRPSIARHAATWRGDRFWVAVLAIAALGLAWRVAYVVRLRDKPLSGDGPQYHLGALLLAKGFGFVDAVTLMPQATHPPAWTALLAVPSALGLQSLTAQWVVAVAVGTATIVMTGIAARTAFSPRTGVIAAAITAAYPNIWLSERELMSETLVMLGAATMVWITYRFRATPGWGWVVALGAAVGFLALTRSELITLAVFLVVPLVLSVRGVSWRRRVGWLALAGCACALVVAPWSIYNSTRFERPVPISAALGSAMVQGNCGPVYEGPLLGAFKLGCIAFVPNLDDDPSVSDGQYRHAAIEFMKDHKSRVPIVMAARVGRTFSVFRPFQQMHLDKDHVSELWVIRLGFFAYWALLPFAVVGAVAARRRRIPIYPLLAFVGAVLVAVLLTIGQTRYRAPAEISLVLLAAFGIDRVLDAWPRRRAARTSLEPRAATDVLAAESAPSRSG